MEAYNSQASNFVIADDMEDKGLIGDRDLKSIKKVSIDDDTVMDLAKRRLATKKNLIGQVIDYFFLVFFMFTMVVTWHQNDRIPIFFIFCGIWGIRLLVRIFRFIKPSFKDGITAYFREREERRLEAEYIRLKKMKTEYVVSELSK